VQTEPATMSSEAAAGYEEQTARRPLRPLAIQAIGPLTMLAGLVWAVAQPYRITVFHPRGEGFWELAVQPPLLVVLVGVLFAVLVAPGVIADLERAEDDAEG
jgi:hypothetical protein